jgi:hypothetical protein
LTTSAVQPVWCMAPSPAPVSPWKYSGNQAAMEGRSVRFARQDTIEEAWRVVEPLLDNAPPVLPYAPGSWGPDAGTALAAAHGGWRGPWTR